MALGISAGGGVISNYDGLFVTNSFQVGSAIRLRINATSGNVQSFDSHYSLTRSDFSISDGAGTDWFNVHTNNSWSLGLWNSDTSGNINGPANNITFNATGQIVSISLEAGNATLQSSGLSVGGTGTGYAIWSADALTISQNLNGSDVTNLSGNSISIGTVAAARLDPTTAFTNGIAMTNLSGGAIKTGTISDARLSANVALLNANNNFTSSSQKITGILNVTNNSTVPVTVGGSINGDFDISITNLSSGITAAAGYSAYNDSGSRGAFGQQSSGYTTYKTIVANDFALYKSISGNIDFLNDVATGKIILTAGARSTPDICIDSLTRGIGIGTTNCAGAFVVAIPASIQTNTAAFSFNTNVITLGSTFTNQAQRGWVDLSLAFNDSVTGTPSATIVITYATKTNTFIVSPLVIGVAGSITNVTPYRLGPSSKFTVTDTSTGSGASVSINAATSVGQE